MDNYQIEYCGRDGAGEKYYEIYKNGEFLDGARSYDEAEIIIADDTQRHKGCS